MRDSLDLEIEVARPIEEHARLVMNWRNDPDTLKSFIHREPKVWESFWPEFSQTYFTDLELPPLFVRNATDRLAFLRFKHTDHPTIPQRKCCDISVNVNPVKRSSGLGTKSLVLATEYVFKNGTESVLAEIRVENTASVRAFEKAGYRFLDKVEKQIPDTGELCALLRYLRETEPQ